MKKIVKTNGRLPEEMYVPPKVEVTDVLVEQNVLNSGSGNTKDIPGFSGGDW